MKTGIELIAEERQEQLTKHGRTVLQDVAYNSKGAHPFGLLPLRIAAGKMLGVLPGVPYSRDWNKEICEKMDAKSDLEKLVIAGALIAAEIDRLQALSETYTKSTSAPLKPFADSVQQMENPRGIYKAFDSEFKAGDRVRGTWVDDAGRTYFQEGIIIENEKTGLWVQSEPDGGITPIKSFWTLALQNS